MIIDNKEIIKSLLTFDKKGDFYHVRILERKKDKATVKQNEHQSARTVKSYCIESIEHLERKYDEMKILCELFQARAYIYLEKYNHENITKEMSVLLARRVLSNHFDQEFIFDSTVGKTKKTRKYRYWLMDLDEMNDDEVNTVIHIINNISPEIGDKIIARIPTKQGCHLITKKFHTQKFKEILPNLKPHKNSPTLLYYPDSIKKDLDM